MADYPAQDESDVVLRNGSTLHLRPIRPDDLEGQGIGMRILERLAEIAHEYLITTFDAYVLQDNYKMMHVFLDSGFEVHQRLEGGVIHVTLSLTRTPAFEARAARRAQHAVTASMKVFFEPRVVAVVGANRTRGKIASRRASRRSSPSVPGSEKSAQRAWSVRRSLSRRSARRATGTAVHAHERCVCAVGKVRS